MNKTYVAVDLEKKAMTTAFEILQKVVDQYDRYQTSFKKAQDDYWEAVRRYRKILSDDKVKAVTAKKGITRSEIGGVSAVHANRRIIRTKSSVVASAVKSAKKQRLRKFVKQLRSNCILSSEAVRLQEIYSGQSVAMDLSSVALSSSEQSARKPAEMNESAKTSAAMDLSVLVTDSCAGATRQLAEAHESAETSAAADQWPVAPDSCVVSTRRLAEARESVETSAAAEQWPVTPDSCVESTRRLAEAHESEGPSTAADQLTIAPDSRVESNRQQEDVRESVETSAVVELTSPAPKSNIGPPPLVLVGEVGSLEQRATEPNIDIVTLSKDGADILPSPKKVPDSKSSNFTNSSNRNSEKSTEPWSRTRRTEQRDGAGTILPVPMKRCKVVVRREQTPEERKKEERKEKDRIRKKMERERKKGEQIKNGQHSTIQRPPLFTVCTECTGTCWYSADSKDVWIMCRSCKCNWANVKCFGRVPYECRVCRVRAGMSGSC